MPKPNRMSSANQAKWDAAAETYDRLSYGPERRWAPVKRDLFAPMQGKILFLAAGTGLDFEFFPPGQDIDAIDISPRMLERARPRAAAYVGRITLHEMDAQRLEFPGASFDQIFSVCTFCSVPDPVAGLRELRRVLRPGGELRMFEHTGSRWFPFNLMLHVMTPITRRVGPEMNRDTVSNVRKAGFTLREVRNVYLDVVRIIVAD
jgi:ubiquinone/menaquinone biosynthesis C-methylase UbiE